MTPRLFRIWAKARLKAAETEQKQRAWLAFQTAALGRVKAFPTWQSFIGEKPKPQTPEVLMASLRGFAEARGKVLKRSEA